MKKIIILFLGLTIIACKKNPDTFVNNKTDSTQNIKSDSLSTDQNSTDKENTLKQINEEVVQSLKDKNYSKFSNFIHPEKGVRFSMYAFINPKEDKTFSKADFVKYQPTKTIFTWGAMDGSGDLYKETINNYLTKWVYPKDFSKAQVSVNEFQGKGNSLNNLKKTYPKADFTENFINGSGANAEMDWKCLRLVFEEFHGKYYLIGVINDQWTI
ncbi:hypothetical protein ASG22_15820 [Chryseobacterium sp. Leaf405]|uniref:hypothetical protein n=1 Tax=Chryseobacterium sp. Leaf405 TaxID=1736367 RepID=UPI0006FB9277|nr:hypothetical protein [Chryseobacterium sp. Leaf405]KQT21620.1 hypothetical protein ASG22_15820 [Chryseobacterium sp. Leaf405]